MNNNKLESESLKSGVLYQLLSSNTDTDDETKILKLIN